MLIRRMKPLGFSLDEMTELLRLIDVLERGSLEQSSLERGDEPAARQQLAYFIEQATVQRQKLKKQLDMADEFLELLRQR